MNSLSRLVSSDLNLSTHLCYSNYLTCSPGRKHDMMPALTDRHAPLRKTNKSPFDSVCFLREAMTHSQPDDL